MKKNYSKPVTEVFTTELLHCICESGVVPDTPGGGTDAIDILDDPLLNPFKDPFERMLF